MPIVGVGDHPPKLDVPLRDHCNVDHLHVDWARRGPAEHPLVLVQDLDSLVYTHVFVPNYAAPGHRAII